MSIGNQKAAPDLETWLNGRDPEHQPVPGGPTLRTIFDVTYPEQAEARKGTDDGGPAFPCHTNPRPGHLSDAPKGMTLRDYFAAKALQGFAACEEQYSNLDTMAKAAYSWADAMLRARGAA